MGSVKIRENEDLIKTIQVQNKENLHKNYIKFN